MRPRIKNKSGEYFYKIGDIIKGDLPGSKIKHICIILENEDKFGHVKCLPICNFTSKPGGKDDYSIDISKYPLPEHWFDKGAKTTNWIRCNEVDCVHNVKFSESDILGNIKLEFPELWKEVCEAVFSCKISKKLELICDCEYSEIQELIEKGEIPIPDCGCD